MRNLLVALALLLTAEGTVAHAAPAAQPGTTTTTKSETVALSKDGNKSAALVKRTEQTTHTPAASKPAAPAKPAPPAKPKATAKPAPRHSVAGRRPSDEAAVSVAHNFAIPHPEPFLRGLPRMNMQHALARMIRENLKQHPGGLTLLDPARCTRDGSCASPMKFLQSAQVDRPDITLATLADYIDSLQVHILTAEEAKMQFDMDCLDRDKGYQVTVNCGNRKFHTGEPVYMDPKTNKFELAADCANWVRGIHHEPEPVAVVVPKCAELVFPTQSGDTSVRVFIVGPPVPPNACGPRIRPAGEDEYLDGWFDECETVCDGRDIVDDIRMPVERRASYYTATPGLHRIQVPLSFTDPNSPNRVVLCLDRDGRHSDGMLVLPTSYQLVGKMKVATMYYTKEEIPSGAPRLYWPWGEWHGR